MNFSDLSFWIFVVCAVAFLAGVGWLVKSYRDAKYAAYFFLREEAALRVKRLMFVLVPLAVVVVFLGLRLFGAEEQVTPPEGTIEATAEVTPTTRAATATYTVAPVLTDTATIAAVTEEVTEAATEAPAETAEAVVTEPSEPTEAVEPTEAAEPTEPAEPATPTSTPSEEAGTTEVAATEEPAATLTGTPPIEADVTLTPTMTLTATSPVAPAGTPVATTETVTGTVEPSPTPTATDTPVFSTVTPNPEVRIEPITFSLGVTSDLDPEDPGTVFSPTEDYIYAFFEYRNMQNGVAWRHVWFRGSEELGSQGSLWEWGSDGRAYVFFAPVGGYTPGRYRVRIYVGEELKQSGSFVIR